MRYFMDWEFDEDGVRVNPISVALVCEDGRELYLINSEYDLSRFADNDRTAVFLRNNVLPTLPVKVGLIDPYAWDVEHPHYDVHVFHRAAMRAQILHFMRARLGVVELWADYGVYDMMCLNQLWGRMIDKDPILPYYCNDLQQTLRSFQINPVSLPQQDPETLHNALGDARHLRDCYDWARSIILNRHTMVRHEP